jgi:6-phosphogluconate dehydrogenase
MDPETGKTDGDIILDEAQQKGTVMDSSKCSGILERQHRRLNSGVECRILSSLKEERVHASRILTGPDPKYYG